MGEFMGVSPSVQKARTEYYEKGKREGEIRTLHYTLVKFVQINFPELTALARGQVPLCQNAEVLYTVTNQLYAAPDVRAAQRLLESLLEI